MHLAEPAGMCYKQYDDEKAQQQLGNNLLNEILKFTTTETASETTYKNKKPF